MSQQPEQTLLFKPILYSGLSILTLILIFIPIIFLLHSQYVEKAKNYFIQLENNFLQQEIQKKHDVSQAIALAFSKNTELQKAIAFEDRKNIMRLIEGIDKSFQKYSTYRDIHAHIFTENGRSLVNTFNYERHGHLITNNPTVRSAVETKSTASGIAIGSTNTLRLTFILPIADFEYPKEITGFMAVSQNMQTLIDGFAKRNRQYASFVQDKEKPNLFIKANERIFDPFPVNEFETDFQAQDGPSYIEKNNQHFIIFRSKDDKSYPILHAIKIPNTEFQNWIDNEKDFISTIFTSIILSISIFSILILSFIHRQIISPLNRFKETINHIIDHKNYNQVLDFQQNNEIGRVSKAFNTLLKRTDKLLQTQTKQTEELIEAKKQAELKRAEAESAAEAKTRFLAQMTHETLTPLNSIVGFSQLLKRRSEEVPEKQQKQIDNIYQASQHLHKLLSEALHFAQIESKMDDQESPAIIEMTTFVPKVINMLTFQAEQARIKLHEKIEINNNDHTCCPIKATPVIIERILINFITNAIKYNHSGGNVWVSVYLVRENSRPHVCIEIKDDGIGIAKEKQLKIFQPFERLGQEENKIQGTGIGLTLTNELIKKMDGKIRLQSEEDKGTTFYVYLPLATESN